MSKPRLDPSVIDEIFGNVGSPKTAKPVRAAMDLGIDFDDDALERKVSLKPDEPIPAAKSSSPAIDEDIAKQVSLEVVAEKIIGGSRKFGKPAEPGPAHDKAVIVVEIKALVAWLKSIGPEETAKKLVEIGRIAGVIEIR